MKYTAEYFIEKLNMQPHPEGGYYNECFQSELMIQASKLDSNFDGDRNLWTSIYFLLREGEVSHFHRLKSDELWYYHAGESLTIYVITEDGNIIEHQLGLDMEKGEQPQVLVPKNCIFGSTMKQPGYSLVGCMVSPWFTYKDFEMIPMEDLLLKHSGEEEIIRKMSMTRNEIEG
jgi:predicted cupin superfamily sugar epimerase